MGKKGEAERPAYGSSGSREKCGPPPEVFERGRDNEQELRFELMREELTINRRPLHTLPYAENPCNAFRNRTFIGKEEG